MGICSGKQPQRDSQKHASEVKRFARQNIRQFYKFGRVLGSGSFGTVKIGYSLRDNKEYAIKTIHKYRMREQFYLVLRELDILTQLDHPNIIKVFEEYEDDMYYHFVMEYCSGGELLERIVKKEGYIGESDAKVIMQQLFSAINYLHSMGIAHRDLKPENVLFATPEPDSEIKIIDFGLSKKFRNLNKKLQRMNSKVGTPIYVAPEIIAGDYSFQCDEWSLGCILHVLLSGSPPFQANKLDMLEAKIKFTELDFSQAIFKQVSKEAKELIKGLLSKHPKKRTTCAQALESPWFKVMKSSSHKSLSNQDHEKVLRLLHTYANSSKLKKETLKILINQLTEQQISQLKDVFVTYDKDCNGTISIPELLAIMNKLGFKESEQELMEMIKKLNDINPSQDDITLDATIKYTSFLSALVNSKSFLNKERLWNLFKYFDSDNKNFITIQDINRAFEREGRQLSETKLVSLFREIAKEEQQTITFEGFCRMMQDSLYSSDHNMIENELYQIQK